MKIAYILFHDFRFVKWSLKDFIKRKYHFSKGYLEIIRELGHEAVLYTLHQEVASPVITNYFRIFPVEFRFPPLLEFGNEFSLRAINDVLSREFDVVHIHNYYLWSVPLLVLKYVKKESSPIMAQFHGDVDPFSNFKLKAFSNIYRMINLFLVSFEFERKKLNKLANIPQERIRIFPNVGIDTSFFRPYKKSPEPVILYVGRFPRKERGPLQKKPTFVVKLFKIIKKLIPEVKLFMVGEGDGLSRVKKHIKRQRLEGSVRFFGYVPRDMLPKIYSWAWLTIIPAKFPELTYLWDGSLKESLACMTPVLVFGDKVDWKYYGLMVPQNNMLKAAEEVVKAIKHLERLFDLKRARQVIMKVCSWDLVGRALVKMYEDIKNRYDLGGE